MTNNQNFKCLPTYAFSSCGCQPGQPIPPATQPFATCCMVCPPPCLAPTQPQPVKPLRLPCPSDSQEVRSRMMIQLNSE